MAFSARAGLLTLAVSGAVYWIAYDRATKQTTVHVDSGSVWLTRSHEEPS